jgi:prepilin peptidase CpaA
MAATPFIVFAVLYLAGLVSAALTDIVTRSIPNVLVLVIAVASVALLLLGAPGALLQHGMVALAVLAGGALLFALRLWGAGDAKLLAAASVLLGGDGLPQLILVTALSGGVIALFLLIARSLPGRSEAASRGVPYGVAIACGAVATFVKTAPLISLLGP